MLDGLADERPRGEVEHRRAVVGEDGGGGVGDVTLDEGGPVRDRLPVARREVVDDRHPVTALEQDPRAHAADVPCATGDEDVGTLGESHAGQASRMRMRIAWPSSGGTVSSPFALVMTSPSSFVTRVTSASGPMP